MTMFRTYRIGKLFGFPIEVNLTFLILLGVMAIWMGPLIGLAFVTIAFSSVLLHELGHAVVARKLDVPIGGIELHFFGGAAKMMRMPKSANHEILISAAGPAVSFALAGVGLLLYTITGLGIFSLFMWINMILGGFNLVPALPMDGGRIFRAAMTKKFSFIRATEISVFVARGFAIALIVYAVFAMQIYMGMLALLLWYMSSAELAMARQMGDPYAAQQYGHTEVMPRGFEPGNPGGFVIRRRGGRLFIEYTDR